MNGEIKKIKYYDYMLSYSPYDNIEAKLPKYINHHWFSR